MLHQAKNEGLYSSYNGKKEKKKASPNLNCTFHLAGEIMRAEYATVY